MLIKAGSLYLTIGTFIYDEGPGELHFNGKVIQLPHKAEVELKAVLDSVIAAQQTIDEQVKIQIEKTNQLNTEIAKIAQYEKDLMAKAAQVDAAYAAMQHQKSPVIVPPSFGRKRG